MKTGEELVHSLLQILVKESNEALLEDAINHLGMIGPPAEPAILALANIIARNPITPTPDELRLNLDRNIPWGAGRAAFAAMEALKRISPKKAIEVIGVQCDDSDPQIRFRALLTLQVIAEPIERVVPRLVEFSRDPETKIRRAAILALWAYQNLDEAALNSLLPLTADLDSIVRLRTDYLLASKLSGYQRRYIDGINDLVNMLRPTTDAHTAHDIIRTVSLMGSDAVNLVESIVELLRSKSPITTYSACAIVNILREIVCHHPSLAMMIRLYLNEIGVPDNEAACFVNDMYTNNPFAPAGLL
jgi:hypothetical protein